MTGIVVFASLSMLFGDLNRFFQYEPQRDCALADVAVRVVDERGMCVPEANVTFSFYTKPEKADVVKCVSDTNGWVYAKNKCNGEAYVKVRKHGYYETSTKWKERLCLGTLSLDEVRKVHKWSTETVQSEVTLKRIVNPQNLEWLESHEYQIPVTNEVVGFDLRIKDWCKPYGRGEYDDLQFKADLWRSPTNWFQVYAKLEMTMTNSLDGFYWRPIDKFSSFRFAYNADTNAVYSKQFIMEYDSRAGHCTKRTPFPQDEFCIIRTRTKVDQNGHLLDAEYGFLGSNLRFWEYVSFSHILNPRVNDTNLELNVVPDQFKN